MAVRSDVIELLFELQDFRSALHGVVDGQARNHRAARAIDVQVDGLVVVLAARLQHGSYAIHA